MIVKSPAKLILFGEHFIVYPDTLSILTALGIYTSIKTTKSLDNLIHLDFKSDILKLHLDFNMEESSKVFSEAINLHKNFQNTKDILPLKKYLYSNGNFFKAIFGLVNHYYPNKADLKLDISTDIPIGSGLGSSASISSGIIKSILTSNQITINNELLFNLVKEIEDLVHGKSSGIDPKAVINGGLLKFSHKNNSVKEIESINKSSYWQKNLYIVFTGYPKESTGEMVSIVNRYKNKFKKQFQKIQNEIQSNILSFLDNEQPDMIKLLNINGIGLEKIGVVSEKVMKFSEEVRTMGGGIKISGAGGKSEIGSGVVIVKMDDISQFDKLLAKYKYYIIPTIFNVNGLN